MHILMWAENSRHGEASKMQCFCHAFLGSHKLWPEELSFSLTTSGCNHFVGWNHAESYVHVLPVACCHFYLWLEGTYCTMNITSPKPETIGIPEGVWKRSSLQEVKSSRVRSKEHRYHHSHSTGDSANASTDKLKKHSSKKSKKSKRKKEGTFTKPDPSQELQQWCVTLGRLR